MNPIWQAGGERDTPRGKNIYFDFPIVSPTDPIFFAASIPLAAALYGRPDRDRPRWLFDIVVLDMNKTATVSPATFKSKAKYTPFEGWTMRGIPTMTFVAGTLVARDGEIVGTPGTGTIVSPQH